MGKSIDIIDYVIADDLWLISNDDVYLAYSPLRGKCFSVKPKGAELLLANRGGQLSDPVQRFLSENGLLDPVDKFVTDIEKPYTPVSIVLSLSTGCNLRCIYCYASSGEKTQVISKEIAICGINIAMSNARKKGFNEFQVKFHGGGESLTQWKLLKELSEYISNKWEGNVKFSIVTNATLIDESRADWFKKYNFKFTVSLDGPQDIQDTQRPMANGNSSFQACIAGVERLCSRDLFLGIRSTITPINVHRMNELVEIAARLNCVLKVEPFTKTGRGEDGIESLQPNDFIHAFLEARDLADSLGVTFRSTYSPNLKPKARYCSADGEMFLIQHNGKISTCSRVTKIDDDLTEKFFIGQLYNGDLEINDQKVSDLRKLNVQEFHQCEDCFAKYNCAGGCHNTRLLSGGNMPEDHCKMARYFLWDELYKQAYIDNKS